MVWKVTNVADDGIITIEIREKKSDKDPIFVHNMPITDKTKAKEEVQAHCDAIYKKLQEAKTKENPLSSLDGLTG